MVKRKSSLNAKRNRKKERIRHSLLSPNSRFQKIFKKTKNRQTVLSPVRNERKKFENDRKLDRRNNRRIRNHVLVNKALQNNARVNVKLLSKKELMSYVSHLNSTVFLVLIEELIM